MYRRFAAAVNMVAIRPARLQNLPKAREAGQQENIKVRGKQWAHGQHRQRCSFRLGTLAVPSRQFAF